MHNKRTLVVRIVAILMAVLMVLGIGTMIFQTVFAADGVPATGSSSSSKLAIVFLVAALVVIAAIALLPKFIKKK